MRKFLGYILALSTILLPVAFLTASLLFGLTVGTEGLTLFLTRISSFVLRGTIYTLDILLILLLIGAAAMASKDNKMYLALARSFDETEKKRTRVGRFINRSTGVIVVLCLIGISYPFTAFFYLVGIVLAYILRKGLADDLEKATASGLGEPGSLVNEVDEMLRTGKL